MPLIKYFSTLYSAKHAKQFSGMASLPTKGNKVIHHFMNNDTGMFDVLEITNNAQKSADNKALYLYELFRNS